MLRALAVRFVPAAAIVAALSAVALPARAQQPPAAPALTINQVDASKYPDVRAVATVLDARGVPVSGLTAAQFQAFDDKTQLTVSSATAAQDSSLGLSVIIVIDVSGSMEGEPLARAKQAATEFAGQLGPNDEAAVVAFNQQVTPVIGLTNDRQRLTDAIAGLQAGGGTALYEAAQTSAYLANAATSPRRAVVLLTDGENDAPGSQATADNSLAVARDSGLPIFTVGFGAAPDATYLQALSGATQGQYRPATVGTVSSVYADLAALLRNQYVVTMRVPGAADGKDATLQLIAFVGGTPVAAVAPYRRGVAPAVAAPTQPAPAPQPAAAPAASSGTNRTPALVVGALLVAALAALALYGALRWQRRRRLQRAQLAVVAPNPRLAAAQGVPASAGGSILRSEPATGRLTLLSDARGSVDLTATPVSIGSDAGCAVRLPASTAVAPQHAMIWVKDQKIMLRHVGGPRRTTIVSGRPVDWVTLEDGDEFSVGPHHFRAERVGIVTPEARR
jgi:VWFA-related protein